MWFEITVCERGQILFTKFGTLDMVLKVRKQFNHEMFGVVAIKLSEDIE